MNFQKTTGQFPSCNHRTEDAWYCYRPREGRPRAVVQLSHGMCEYVERYEPLAEFLCGAGIAFCGHDHPGHGRSAPSAEELGFIDEQDGAGLLVADLRRMNLWIQREFPGLPIILLGHSMGSFVARAYLSRYSDELSGAVICGTSGGNPGAAAGILLAKETIRRRGSHYRSELLNKLAFGSYNHAFGPNLPTVYEWLTADRSIVERYAQDPWCHFVFTAAGFRDLFTLLEQVSAPEWAGTVPADLPLLLIAGEKDPVGDFGRGVRKVAERLIAAGVRNLSLKLYPDGRHEIFNEVNKEEVFSDLLGWLEGCLASAAALTTPVEEELEE